MGPCPERAYPSELEVARYRFLLVFFRAAGFFAARSGSFLLPVSRFHSS